MARAAARQRRTEQTALVAPETIRPPSSDPIKALFASYADLSIGEVMEMTGQRRTTVHRRLVELLEAGVLERRGKGRASRYHRMKN